MTVGEKLLILLVLNVASLAYLVIKLIGRNHSFSKALKLAWHMIIGTGQEGIDTAVSPAIFWAPVLRKTWWMSWLIYGTCWVLTRDFLITVGLVLLILFHIGWYISAAVTFTTKYDRILHLNSQWGIIYKEIAADSSLIQKSLAELDLRKKNLLVLSIERNEQVIPFPKGLEIIQAGDRVVMFGDLAAYYTVLNYIS